MTSYRVLSEAFPHSLVIREQHVAEVIAALVSPNSRFPNGSSFAITVNCEDGKRILWMSESSLERCKEILRAVL